MVEGAVFIGLAIITATEFIKQLAPKNPDGSSKVNGATTIAVSAALGILVALIDTAIGVQDLTIAQGLMTALGASGVVTVAKKV